MEEYKLKKSIDELNLGKFYNDFIREDYSDRFYIEIYAYKVKYEDKDVIYIGNRTIPNIQESYVENKYREAEYWLNGNSDLYFVLYRYINTCNMIGYPENENYNKLGNQKTLNNIKQYIIDNLNTNFNIMIMPKNYDLFEQIGRQIYEWKSNIKKEIPDYSLDEFIQDFIKILNIIKNNSLYWHKYLIKKNRFWFISESNDDIEERKNIEFDDLSIRQKVIVIIMKEWLGMIVNQSYLDINYNMHIDKVIYKLQNTNFKNKELFNNCKTKLFEHKTAIKIILSTMYSNSTARQVEDVYSKFMNWRKNYIIKIFNR